MLVPGRWGHHGGRGNRGRAGRETQVRLRAVDVQGLSAVFAAAWVLSPPGKELRGAILGCCFVGCGLGGDAMRELNCGRDDGVAALQQMPDGGGRGVGGRRNAAGHGGRGASRGELRPRVGSTGDVRALGQLWWFGWTNWPVSPQREATSSWQGERERGQRKMSMFYLRAGIFSHRSPERDAEQWKSMQPCYLPRGMFVKAQTGEHLACDVVSNFQLKNLDQV